MLRTNGLLIAVAMLALGCGRTDLDADVPSNETDSTTISMEDTTVPDTGESADWGEEEATAEWGEEEATAEWGEESGWGESGSTDWGEESGWGESGWGEESGTSWGESGTSWGESGTSWSTTDTTDTGTTDTGTTDTGTTDTGTTDTGTTDTGTTDTGTTDTGTTDTGTTDTTDTGGDQTCNEATGCLIDCGDYSQMCVQPCTDGLMGQEQQNFFNLQICALQACFFDGQCGFDFNAPQCVACRLEVSKDPDNWGCGPEGQACGI